MIAHSKIIIDDSVLGNCAFADYYRFRNSDGPAPLLCYIGGSINQNTYLSRLKSTPEPIVDEFRKAWEEVGQPSLDFLVSSAPPNQGDSRHNGVLQDFFNHFMFEILSRTQNSRPTALAFVGNSFGAHLASYLAFTLARTKALATIAGCGMADAARQTPMIGIENKLFKLFSNIEDGTEYEDEEFKRLMGSHGIALDVVRRHGGHSFDDYRANGALKDAFAFCLSSLQAVSTQLRKRPVTIALDLEGTLISHASSMVPRSGLHDFLTFCHQQFERVLFFSFVDKEHGRKILNTMADNDHMPEWVRSAEYFHAEGGRPGAKDLHQLGVDPEHALLVDDQPQVLPRNQLHRLIRIPEFREPYEPGDQALLTVRRRLENHNHLISILGDYELNDEQLCVFSHLIFISNPDSKRRPPKNFQGNCLQLWFGDVFSEQDAAACRTRAAQEDDIRRAIVFYRVTRQQDYSSLLVSCDYGASRSPAVAYVLLADQYGPGREEEALQTVLAIRPGAVPNALVASFGDQLLKRQDALMLPLRQYYKHVEAEIL